MRCCRFFVMAALAVAAAAVAAQPQLRYRVQKLELPDDFPGVEGYQPVAVNNHGEVLVNLVRGGGEESRVYLYRNGRAQRLPGSEAFPSLYATNLNDRGQVVGSLRRPPGPGPGFMAYLYEQGQFKDPAADLRPYTFVSVNDLSASGRSTGVIDGRAFTYDGVRARRIDLPGSTDSAGLAINDRGTVVGSATYPIGGGAETTRIFIRDGDGTEFVQWPSRFFPEAITDLNNAGQVAGHGVLDYSLRVAFIYADGRFTDIGNLGDPGRPVQLLALNEKGWGVGWAYVPDVVESPRAFLYREGGMANLNDLLRPADAARWTLSVATDVNDLGWVTAYGTRRDGRSFMVVAAPVPEAGAWALWLGGLAGLGWRLRRRGPGTGRRPQEPASPGNAWLPPASSRPPDALTRGRTG